MISRGAQVAPPALAPADASAALEKRRADTEKAILAGRIAGEFLRAGDGKGLNAALHTMLAVMLDTKAKPRTRALVAARFVRLAQQAAQASPDAVLPGAGVPGPSQTREDVTLLEVISQHPDGRAALYARLAAGTGVRLALADALKAVEAPPERVVDAETTAPAAPTVRPKRQPKAKAPAA